MKKGPRRAPPLPNMPMGAAHDRAGAIALRISATAKRIFSELPGGAIPRHPFGIGSFLRRNAPGGLGTADTLLSMRLYLRIQYSISRGVCQALPKKIRSPKPKIGFFSTGWDQRGFLRGRVSRRGMERARSCSTATASEAKSKTVSGSWASHPRIACMPSTFAASSQKMGLG